MQQLGYSASLAPSPPVFGPFPLRASLLERRLALGNPRPCHIASKYHQLPGALLFTASQATFSLLERLTVHV